MDVYICLRCFGLIIFRYPWHQIFHIPSGWHCWKDTEEGESSLGSFEFPTPEETRGALMKSFKKIYRKSKPRSDVKPPFRFISDMWKQKKPDMIHDILGFLVDQSGDFADELINKIGKSKEWKQYVNIRKKYPIPRKKKSRH